MISKDSIKRPYSTKTLSKLAIKRAELFGPNMTAATSTIGNETGGSATLEKASKVRILQAVNKFGV